MSAMEKDEERILIELMSLDGTNLLTVQIAASEALH